MPVIQNPDNDDQNSNTPAGPIVSLMGITGMCLLAYLVLLGKHTGTVWRDSSPQARIAHLSILFSSIAIPLILYFTVIRNKSSDEQVLDLSATLLGTASGAMITHGLTCYTQHHRSREGYLDIESQSDLHSINMTPGDAQDSARP